jgi:hypothetical protein
MKQGRLKRWVPLFLGLAFFACKTRNSSTGLKADGGDYYAGPNMSACAENPAACRCVLNNEFDTPNFGPPDDPEKRKAWFSQCIGQEVWYKASAGSGRFHVYFQSQRLGAVPDWGAIFHNEARKERFENWGVVNDPSCCTPGDDNCRDKMVIDAKTGEKRPVTLDDTYGFQFCPGDDVLLGYVGSGADYTEKDPGCAVAKLAQNTGLAASDSSCHLAFGTSTGGVGFRKFPNPRFNKEKWRALNGDMSSWANFSRRIPGSGKIDYDGDSKNPKLRIDDASVEPPFYIGETCGSCHVGFNPVKPPENQDEPQWDNILFAIGNTYLHVSEMLGSGSKPGTFPHEIFLHIRPGTVDTSAITNDYNNNPGTFNALINLDRRPGLVAEEASDLGEASHDSPSGRFFEDITTYAMKPNGEFGITTEKKRVPHVLKGGEDSIGPAGAVQRVYINIFSCTETCLGNHLDDPRVLSSRSARQTPYNFAQCRRDCPSYRAIEDRVGDIFNFLVKVRPNDLKDHPVGQQAIAAVAQPDLEQGKQLFVDKCAQCHSSFPEQPDNEVGRFNGSGFKGPNREVALRILSADLAKGKGQPRVDWLGSDVQIPAKLVGTNYCRALHSNHLEGHLWQYYASDTYRSDQRYSGYPDELFQFAKEHLDKSSLSGRGFYRSISLMNAWAHAPFMHNNGIGYDWQNPMFKLTGVADNESLAPSPSVERRLEMYQASMQQLLTSPSQRRQKIERTQRPVEMVLGPRLPEQLSSIENFVEEKVAPFTLKIPAGIPINIIGSLRHKQLMADFVQAASQGSTYPERIENALTFLRQFEGTDPDAVAQHLIDSGYVNCADLTENGGHDFGTDLSPTEKNCFRYLQLCSPILFQRLD